MLVVGQEKKDQVWLQKCMEPWALATNRKITIDTCYFLIGNWSLGLQTCLDQYKIEDVIYVYIK